MATSSSLAPAPLEPWPLVGLVVDRMDWHARRMAEAIARHGGRSVPMRLEACGFDSGRPSGLAIPGFEARLPDAVVVRTMSGGSFEAVTLRLGILHALRDCGVPVWNDARAIERCVDKSMTGFLLARARLPTPPTWVTESEREARAVVERECAAGPLVLKPLFGSQGRGLRLVTSPRELPERSAVSGVYYLQRYIPVGGEGFRDFRVLVSGGRPVAAMMRHSQSWITNVKQGGRPVAAMIDGELRDLSVAAAGAVGADFAGVDILYGTDGQPTILEVNSMPAWSGLQRVASVDIAATIVDDLLDALKARAAPT